MRIYISGSITGNDNHKKQFAQAAKELEAKGNEVLSPVAFDNMLPQLTYEEYMKFDLCLLDMCEAIYMLQGWEKSPGANREYGYALAKNLRIFRESDVREVQ